jgi:MFS family permease
LHEKCGFYTLNARGWFAMFGIGAQEMYAIGLFLIPQIVAGIFTAFIARSKGRSFGGWFWLGLFFSLLALLAVAIMPAVKPDEKNLPSDLRKCPNCAEVIKAEAKVCRFCGRDVTV